MKQIISGKEIISAIITGIVVGIVILIITMSWEQKASFGLTKGEINEADNFNLTVACRIKNIYNNTENNLLMNYITQSYTENFDILNKQSSSTKAAIMENIALMQASNKMMGLLIDQPERRNEFKEKLIKNAEEIINNLDIYNDVVVEEECAN